RRALPRDDELRRIDVDDARDALEDAAVVALEQPLLLAAGDDDLVEVRLRADVLRVLVVDRALVEDGGTVARPLHDPAAAATAAAPAAATAPAATAATADHDERAGRVHRVSAGAIALKDVPRPGLAQVHRELHGVLAVALGREQHLHVGREAVGRQTRRALVDHLLARVVE